MKLKRAERRSHYFRKKREVVTKQFFRNTREYWLTHPQFIGLYANTPKTLACSCCCNPRRSKDNSGKWSLTLQERRSDLTLKEELGR